MKHRWLWMLAGVCLLTGGIDRITPRVAAQAASQSSPQSASASSPPGSSSAATYDSTVKPLIQQNCIGCHNATRLKGDLDLEQFLTKPATEALKDRNVFELVIQKLQAGEMPPAGKPRPSPEQVSAAATWIQQQYAAMDASAPPRAGRVTAHRLNRYEYNNTVRDLLAVNLRFADDFPPDPYGYGFDNIGDVLSLSPMLTEKYMKAAEEVAHAAIRTGAPPKAVSVRYEPQKMGQRDKLHVQAVHDFPVDGLYTLRFGWEQAVPNGTIMTGHFYIDGKEVSRQPIVFNTHQDVACYGREIPVTQGAHRYEAAIELAPDSQQPRTMKGRMPYITEMEVFGPFKPVAASQTASYRRIFYKGPPAKRNQAAYAREILTRLSHRAYRRPVAPAELDRLVSLSTLVRRHGGSFEESIQVALEAILMSPDFLFRIEQDPATGTAHRITDVELASRLSYFLWSSTPDDELLAVAEKGVLHQPDVLHAQVRRLLRDPRAHALAENFGGQWLQTRNLQFQKPDHKTFPEYDAELEEAMRTETELFFQAIVTEDRSVLDFVDGRFTYLNQRLAKLYGIPGVEGSEFRRVELDGAQRSGVLTQASVLRASSYPTRTSPVIRGKWILDNILNAPPPGPPPNVPALDDHDVGKVASVRQRLEEHRANPVCASCHGRMDPLGFALENYDAIGRWRTSDGAFPIDATGQLPDGTTFTGASQLKAILRADSPRFVRGLSEKMLTYALGRGVESYDRPAVEKIAQRVEKNGYHFSELINAIVDSVPFQMREPELRKDQNIHSADFHHAAASNAAPGE